MKIITLLWTVVNILYFFLSCKMCHISEKIKLNRVIKKTLKDIICNGIQAVIFFQIFSKNF